MVSPYPVKHQTSSASPPISSNPRWKRLKSYWLKFFCCNPSRHLIMTWNFCTLSSLLNHHPPKVLVGDLKPSKGQLGGDSSLSIHSTVNGRWHIIEKIQSAPKHVCTCDSERRASKKTQKKNTQCYVSFVHRSPLATSSSGKLLVHQFILSIRCSMYRGGIPPTTHRTIPIHFRCYIPLRWQSFNQAKLSNLVIISPSGMWGPDSWDRFAHL